jgi:hypothetical protein
VALAATLGRFYHDAENFTSGEAGRTHKFLGRLVHDLLDAHRGKVEIQSQLIHTDAERHQYNLHGGFHQSESAVARKTWP